MFARLLAWSEYMMKAPTTTGPHSIYGQTFSPENGTSPLFSEELFVKLLSLERKRAERSRKPFALMLVDASKLFRTDSRAAGLSRVLVALSSCLRETDVWGWHKEGAVIGVILTEIGSADAKALHRAMPPKVHSALRAKLEPDQVKQIRISLHVFPGDSKPPNDGSGDNGFELYPDLHPKNDAKRAARLVKRAIDIAGSFAALILLSPVFLAIAVAVKLTSKGPMLFKQSRIGQYGKEFKFLKFRSMCFQNDPTIHQEYVRQFISGNDDCKQGGDNGVYKLRGDARITPLGSFLRRTSLDELPQFLNVLRGEMSLVGPRPPIPYEIEAYDIWHRRRFVEVKPGITGLWQVKGRSRLKFDEMVRLDIQYIRSWSLGLDLKILLQTPRAVLRGEGAY